MRNGRVVGWHSLPDIQMGQSQGHMGFQPPIRLHKWTRGRAWVGVTRHKSGRLGSGSESNLLPPLPTTPADRNTMLLISLGIIGLFFSWCDFGGFTLCDFMGNCRVLFSCVIFVELLSFHFPCEFLLFWCVLSRLIV